MALESVVIKGETYQIHQEFPAYGTDLLGNPVYLGEDYHDVELLSYDKAISLNDQICYTFTVNLFDSGDGFSYSMDFTQPEDLFVAYCCLEIEDSKNPTVVSHKNGDQWDNSPENLVWEYTTKD